MKKVVFIHLLNDYSGSPKVLAQIARSCINNKVDIDLYFGRGSDGFLTAVSPNEYHFYYRRFNNKLLTLLSYLISQIVLFFKLLKYSNEDVVIYVNTLLPFGAAIAAKIIGKPVYYHVHETSLRPLLLKKFLRYVVNKTASKVIYVSKSLAEQEGFPGLKKEIVYNSLSKEFVEIALLHTYKHKFNGKFQVLMVCSLKEYKGVNEFVEIARLCECEEGIKFNLVLNAGQKEIDDYYSSIDLPQNITLYSRQKNLYSFYEQASLLLNLSRIDGWVETFGLTILEAMSFGVPVIVPPVGGPAEIVKEGKEGYLISSYEVNGISKKILDLSMDKNMCMMHSRYSRKRSLDFDHEAIEKTILDIILE